jgi:hypothetical protein
MMHMSWYLLGIDILTIAFELEGIAQSEYVVQKSPRLSLRQVAGSSQKASPGS